MKFRKISTIVLLCSVLVVSVLFSLFIYREGFQEGLPEMKNPTPLEMKRITDILDGTGSRFQKILDIRTYAKEYTALNDVYSQNSRIYLNALMDAIQTPPEKQSDGTLVDANAITSENRDKANAINASTSDYSNIEKLEKIKGLIGNDKNLNTICDKYEYSWIQLIREYIDNIRENSSANAATAAAEGKY